MTAPGREERDALLARIAKKRYETPAWQRKEGQNPKGGLNAKGRASYARETGGKLRPPVKSGDNPRRASFLARMGNMPGPERDENGEPTRLLLSLQAWGASSKADARAKAKRISARLQAKKSAEDVEKGEGPGHPFRGNQHVRGRTGAISATAGRELKTGGGFTIDPRKPTKILRMGESDGFVVATHPQANRQIPSTQLRTQAQRREAIGQYIKDNEATLAANKYLHVGGWLDKDTGTVHLDLVSVMPSRAQAVAVGKQHGELAIFDLKSGEEIFIKEYRYGRTEAGSDGPPRGSDDRSGHRRVLPDDRTGPSRGRVNKGEGPGHPFRGNQHVKIGGGSAGPAMSNSSALSIAGSPSITFGPEDTEIPISLVGSPKEVRRFATNNGEDVPPIEELGRISSIRAGQGIVDQGIVVDKQGAWGYGVYLTVGDHGVNYWKGRYQARGAEEIERFDVSVRNIQRVKIIRTNEDTVIDGPQRRSQWDKQFRTGYDAIWDQRTGAFIVFKPSNVMVSNKPKRISTETHSGVIKPITKGEGPGHPFRGNQHVKIGGGLQSVPGYVGTYATTGDNPVVTVESRDDIEGAVKAWSTGNSPELAEILGEDGAAYKIVNLENDYLVISGLKPSSKGLGSGVFATTVYGRHYWEGEFTSDRGEDFSPSSPTMTYRLALRNMKNIRVISMDEAANENEYRDLINGRPSRAVRPQRTLPPGEEWDITFREYDSTLMISPRRMRDVAIVTTDAQRNFMLSGHPTPMFGRHEDELPVARGLGNNEMAGWSAPRARILASLGIEPKIPQGVQDEVRGGRLREQYPYRYEYPKTFPKAPTKFGPPLKKTWISEAEAKIEEIRRRGAEMERQRQAEDAARRRVLYDQQLRDAGWDVPVEKGEGPGHPFRGNQYVRVGGGMSFSSGAALTGPAALQQLNDYLNHSGSQQRFLAGVKRVERINRGEEPDDPRTTAAAERISKALPYADVSIAGMDPDFAEALAASTEKHVGRYPDLALTVRSVKLDVSQQMPRLESGRSTMDVMPDGRAIIGLQFNVAYGADPQLMRLVDKNGYLTGWHPAKNESFTFDHEFGHAVDYTATIKMGLTQRMATLNARGDMAGLSRLRQDILQHNHLNLSSEQQKTFTSFDSEASRRHFRISTGIAHDGTTPRMRAADIPKGAGWGYGADHYSTQYRDPSEYIADSFALRAGGGTVPRPLRPFLDAIDRAHGVQKALKQNSNETTNSEKPLFTIDLCAGYTAIDFDQHPEIKRAWEALYEENPSTEKAFRSKAQWRWAFATDQPWARRWAHETPGNPGGRFRRLPRYVKTSRSKANLAQRKVKKDIPVMKAEVVFDLTLKGEGPGHPFRGNQYVRGKGGRSAATSGGKNVDHSKSGPAGAVYVDKPQAAMALIRQGKSVIMPQSALSDTFLAMLDDTEKAKASGEKPFTYDLAKISVAGIPYAKQPWSNKANNLGFDRSEMPQVPKEGGIKDMFFRELRASGTSVKQGEVQPTQLRAIQDEISGANVGNVIRGMRSRRLDDARILISQEGHVLDGHHRWAASIAEGVPIRVDRVGMSTKNLLDASWAMNRAEGVAAQSIDATGPSMEFMRKALRTKLAEIRRSSHA